MEETEADDPNLSAATVFGTEEVVPPDPETQPPLKRPR